MPFRKLTEDVDGKTAGPNTSGGQIAGMLHFDPLHKPGIESSPVHGCVVKEKQMSDLNADHLHLYEFN